MHEMSFIKEFVKLKSDAYSKAFRFEFLENLWGFVLRYLSLQFLLIVFFAISLDVLISLFLLDVEALFFRFFSENVLVFFVLVFVTLAFYLALRFFYSKARTKFVYCQVIDLRVALTSKLQANFGDSNASRYVLIAKILNHVELFALFLNNCLLGFVELMLLVVLTTLGLALVAPYFVWLWLSLIAFAVVLFVVINLLARNLVNVNQTFKSKIISELFFMFENRRVLNGTFFDRYLQKFKKLNYLDMNFRASRNAWIDLSRNVVFAMAVLMSSSVPLLSRIPNAWAFFVDNPLVILVFSVLVFRVLYLIVNIALYFPLMRISAFCLFQSMPKVKRLPIELDSDFKIFSNKFKLADKYVKNFVFDVYKGGKMLLVTSDVDFFLQVFMGKFSKQANFLYVQKSGRKFSANSFFKKYLDSFCVLVDNLHFDGCLLELFVGEFDFKKDYTYLHQFGLAKFAFEDLDITRAFNTDLMSLEEKIKLQLLMLVTNKRVKFVVVPAKILKNSEIVAMLEKINKHLAVGLIVIDNVDNSYFKYES